VLKKSPREMIILYDMLQSIIKPEEILGRLGAEAADNHLTAKKQKWRLRDLCIYIMSRMGAYTNREIGELFGVGYTAITGTVKRAEKHLEKSKRLQRLIDKTIDEL